MHQDQVKKRPLLSRGLFSAQ